MGYDIRVVRRPFRPQPRVEDPLMPLQNRVSPTGDLLAAEPRGSLMGNRGGRLHDDARNLTNRRWVTKSWIACRLHFKDRHRDVMSTGYTELFFLDEVTALAAGILRGSLEQVGAEHPRVETPAAESLGDEMTIFRVQWDPW